jgi:hypothetical protein
MYYADSRAVVCVNAMPRGKKLTEEEMGKIMAYHDMKRPRRLSELLA